uniref:Uncharacterized protein LOC104222830 n=1 Tax=Nicotiana sylvestris TaxID=4096 RepID=A0A1U7WDZ9_NICSY|nr:PREDICTED: uncharacterized protein LOC104222830 [Nicotiana sylvestris]
MNNVKNKAILIKQNRGKTKMKSVHRRHERKLILLNNFNQPVGHSEGIVIELGSFLGTLGRNATLCPLDILDWRKIDTKEDIWEYTKDKYDIPETGKKYILESVQAAWRKHKSRLKNDHFDPYPNDETRMQHIPEDVLVSQFKELLRYWNSEKLQVQRLRKIAVTKTLLECC